MWLLIVASCIAGDPGPGCGSRVHPVGHQTLEACADAAVRYHDGIRSIAAQTGTRLLLVDTHCFSVSAKDPA